MDAEATLQRIYEILYLDTRTVPSTLDMDKEWDVGMLDDIAEAVLDWKTSS